MAETGDDGLTRRDRRVTMLECELARAHLLLATSTARVQSLEKQITRTVMGIAEAATAPAATAAGPEPEPEPDSERKGGAIEPGKGCVRCQMLERQLMDVNAFIASGQRHPATIAGGGAAQEDPDHRAIEAAFLTNDHEA